MSDSSAVHCAVLGPLGDSSLCPLDLELEDRRYRRIGLCFVICVPSAVEFRGFLRMEERVDLRFVIFVRVPVRFLCRKCVCNAFGGVAADEVHCFKWQYNATIPASWQPSPGS